MKIAVLGSGSWGTALAQVLCDNNHEVMIWGNNLDQIVDIQLYHQNEHFFPGLMLNQNIQATQDIQVIKDSEVFILAVPSIAIEEICIKLNEILTRKVIIVNVAKGFHPATKDRLSLLIERTISPEYCEAVVSLIGPSHAEEVIQRLLTVVNAVSANEQAAHTIQHLFSNNYFRVYRGSDVIGSEYGVAIKNIIAICSGVLTGLGQGDNARAALITRGLAEMTRFGVAMGGNPMTFIGLTGVGDLIVTATSEHSRNFQAGLIIGRSNDAKPFWDNNEKTVEGVFATKIVKELADQHEISMPITEAIYQVLYEKAIPSEMIETLMSRELKAEDIV